MAFVNQNQNSVSPLRCLITFCSEIFIKILSFKTTEYTKESTGIPFICIDQSFARFKLMEKHSFCEKIYVVTNVINLSSYFVFFH